MVSVRSILTGTLLLGGVVNALPQGLPGLGDGPLGDIMDDVSDAVEDVGGAVGDAVSSVMSFISNAGAKNMIPNRYIVVYNDTFDTDSIDAKEAYFTSEIKKRNLNKRSMHSGSLLSTDVRSFKMNNWRAMMLDADDDMITEIFNSDEVEYVEADTQVSVNALVSQTNAPVGLNRLSHNQAGADTYVFDDSAGEGITAYVLDTGVLTTHTEFEGRATFGQNFINDVVC